MKGRLLIRNVRLGRMSGGCGDLSVDSAGRISVVGNVAVADEEAYVQVVDRAGCLLMPGLIDSHVHLREPGLTHKADIASESRALIAGGITSFFDMPNTLPPTASLADIAYKMQRAAETSLANYAFFPAATAQTASWLYPGTRIFPGVKLFMGSTTGGLGAPEGKDLEELFRACAALRIPIMIHAEDNGIIAANTAAAIGRYCSRENVPLEQHASIRNRRACLTASAKAVELAHRYGTRLHLAHISTAEEAKELLQAANVEDKLVTAETTPLYIDPGLNTKTWRTKVNPAIKNEKDREELLLALSDGRIDTIGTDHAPHLIEEKQGGALTAASGAPGAQHALVRMLSYLPPELIAEKMAQNPAKIFGLKDRGELREGYVADMVLLEKVPEYAIDDSMTLGKCGWTPLHGLKATYKIKSVYLAGRRAFPAYEAAPAPLCFS